MIDIKRSVEATLIPSGVKVTLVEGTPVLITQALGGAYTVHVNGNLVRISGKDGDALGLVAIESDDINLMAGTLEEKVWRQLSTCFDPEIPVNIVDLGLIYHCCMTTLPQKETDEKLVEVTMTLTAPGCGMGPVLVKEIEDKIHLIDQVTEVKIILVFDPPWDRDKMSEAAKLQLGLL